MSYKSLSARRAWIEITGTMGKSNNAMSVALRKESVDRNFPWVLMGGLNFNVALRKESVDRNTLLPNGKVLQQRRSPQGERG